MNTFAKGVCLFVVVLVSIGFVAGHKEIAGLCEETDELYEKIFELHEEVAELRKVDDDSLREDMADLRRRQDMLMQLMDSQDKRIASINKVQVAGGEVVESLVSVHGLLEKQVSRNRKAITDICDLIEKMAKLIGK